MNTKTLILGAWTDDEPPEWATAAEKNHSQYATTHGYRHFFARVKSSDIQNGTQARVSPTWAKVSALRKALASDDWSYVFLIDMDSIFADPTRSLKDLIALKKTLVITGDTNDLCNTGHMLIRSNQAAIALVNEWWSLRNTAWPELPTTHQDSQTGLVNDQVAFNYLLAGGEPTPSEVEEKGLRSFNRTNGFKKNKDRQYKHFDKLFAPTNGFQTMLSPLLVTARLRKEIAFVPQQRLNWYPLKGPPIPRKHPIAHYPGGLKHRLVPDLDFLAQSGQG